ncbi:uncharacterized protein LOC143915567 [Arctopsyche grandis]|uniref:uncharacterized protein LOC143915567 n=1 Tax=Arctopsyche grandis TaxID=121162 RepID=UPI00406D81DE
MDKLKLRSGTNIYNDSDYYNAVHWNYREFTEFPVKLLRECNPVTDLYLKENRIEKLPRDIACVFFVGKLYLDGNNIRAFPVEMCRLPYLTHLDMSGNLLITIPEEICQLTNLQTLILDDNQLRWLPISLQNMTNLKELSVNDNSLYWFPQKIGSNYYSSSVRFWRNRTLHHVPFALWLHVLNDSQLPVAEKLCRLDDLEWSSYAGESLKNTVRIGRSQMELVIPQQFHQIEQCASGSPASLLELCLRRCYIIYYRVLKADAPRHEDENNNEIDKMPNWISRTMQFGPTAFCDVSHCNCPLFGYAVLAVCVRDVDNESGRILATAFFCSKSCCEFWKRVYNTEPLEWTLTR